MEDEKAVRAAFAYLGTEASSGLTLVALAKAAGILIDFRNAEIAKLALESRSLKASFDAQMTQGLEIEEQRDKARAEVEGLLLQNARYRAALEEVIDLFWKSNSRDYSPAMERAAKAALPDLYCQAPKELGPCFEKLPCKAHGPKDQPEVFAGTPEHLQPTGGRCPKCGRGVHLDGKCPGF